MHSWTPTATVPAGWKTPTRVSVAGEVAADAGAAGSSRPRTTVRAAKRTTCQRARGGAAAAVTWVSLTAAPVRRPHRRAERRAGGQEPPPGHGQATGKTTGKSVGPAGKTAAGHGQDNGQESGRAGKTARVRAAGPGPRGCRSGCRRWRRLPPGMSATSCLMCSMCSTWLSRVAEVGRTRLTASGVQAARAGRSPGRFRVRSGVAGPGCNCVPSSCLLVRKRSRRRWRVRAGRGRRSSSAWCGSARGRGAGCPRRRPRRSATGRTGRVPRPGRRCAGRRRP